MEIARSFTEKIICYFGPTAALLTNQGTHFLNNMLNELARILRIDKYCTTAYHPQSNEGI